MTNESRIGKGIRWAARVGFLLLFVFEQLNHHQILHVPLEFTWLGLILTLCPVIIGIELLSLFLRRVLQIQLHWVIWPMALAGVCVDAFGDIFHWYQTYLWYDRMAHAFGSMVAATIFSTVFWDISEKREWHYPVIFNVLFAFTTTVTVGVFYELEEYLEDHLHNTNRLGNGPDTANDLLMNTAGALLMTFLVAFFRWLWKRVFPKQESSTQNS